MQEFHDLYRQSGGDTFFFLVYLLVVIGTFLAATAMMLGDSLGDAEKALRIGFVCGLVWPVALPIFLLGWLVQLTYWFTCWTTGIDLWGAARAGGRRCGKGLLGLVSRAGLRLTPSYWRTRFSSTRPKSETVSSDAGR